MSDDPEFVNYRIEAATVDGPRMPPGEAGGRIIGRISDEPYVGPLGTGTRFDAALTFRIEDWAGPLPPEAFAPPPTDAGGLQWVDAAQTAWRAWEEFSEARDQLCAAGALLRLSDAMDALASWLPGYNADTGCVDDVVSGEVYCADCEQLDGHEGLCTSDARAAFLAGEGTLTTADVQTWARELGWAYRRAEAPATPLMVSVVREDS